MTAWHTKRIDQLGRVVTGKTPSCERPEEFGDLYPFITPSDIPSTRKYIQVERRLSERGLETLRRIQLPPKSTCVVCIGATVGKTCMTQHASVSNQQINSIIPTSGESDPDFVYYISTTLRDSLVSFAGGAATPIINKSTFSSIKVLVPDYAAQRKIAAILSAYDELIETNQRRIALLEKLAEEIYREWFVRFRFPGHAQVKIVKGVPEGWTLEKLEHAFTYTGGGTPSKEVSRYWEGGEINWFTPTDITGAAGMFLSRSATQCTDEGFSNSSAKMFPAYSVMLTSRATIGAVGINTTPACTNQGFITCIPNNRYPLPYLYHWLKLAKPHFESLSVGATFAELTKGTFKRIEILTPPEAIVTAFNDLESPLFEQIETLLSANQYLTRTRDLLLPRLISGKLAVADLDIQFPPGMAD
jgi:type I restriction enzyme S subunit